MPLNSIPPTTTRASVEKERQAANAAPLYADVALWGGVIPSNCNQTNLNDILESGVFGLKAFLSPLPPEAGYESVSPEELMEAAKICGKHNKPILVHSELMTEQQAVQLKEETFRQHGNSKSYQSHLSSRPPKWEQAAVEVVCEAAKHCAMHIVHLSDSGCLNIIEKTKQDPNKRRLFVETCPHYLLLDSSMIPDGNTLVKCFPPIRDSANREKLWEGMEKGLIDIVASDHSPCEPELRCIDTGNVQEAWGGLSGLQYQLQATWTEAKLRNYNPWNMAQWWSKNPCELLGLHHHKGSIAPGMQADLCWWDTGYVGAPNTYAKEYHRWKDTTYYADNKNLMGRVLGTWVRGNLVYDGIFDSHSQPVGELLLRQ